MNEKDAKRVQQATGQQQPQSEQPKHQTVTEHSDDVNGAKIRSMLRKKAIAAQAVDDANSDAEFYVQAYNTALERSISMLTIGTVENNQAENSKANQEVNEDFFNLKNQLTDAMNRINNYQIVPSSSKFLLGSSSN